MRDPLVVFTQNHNLEELRQKAGLQPYHDAQEEHIRKFAELIIKECAAWMEDGNIPDGFYEAARLLRHFGVEE